MVNTNILEDPLLKKWLNPVYLKEDLVQQFHQFYLKNKEELQFMQWTDFLKPEKAKTVAEQLKKGHYMRKYRPDMYKYKESKPYKAVDPLLNLLKSEALKKYMKAVFEQEYKQQQMELRCFAQGDYTLLHDAEETFEGFLLIYDSGTEWQQEYGGYDVVIRPKKDPLIIPPTPNTLAIIKSTKETRWFTKYVNGLTGNKKRYVVWCVCR